MDIEGSRLMDRMLTHLSLPHRYVEFEGLGHGVKGKEPLKCSIETCSISWMKLKQEKEKYKIRQSDLPSLLTTSTLISLSSWGLAVVSPLFVFIREILG